MKIVLSEAKPKIPWKFFDFPIQQTSNFIVPLCLENFAFEPNLPESDMVYHNLASLISELPKIRVKIAIIISHIQDMGQTRNLFFVNGAWKWKELLDDEKKTVAGLKHTISSVSNFIGASQSPSFRHFPPGHSMLCGCISIMYVLSLVRWREEEPEETDDSPKVTEEILTVAGKCG